MKRFPANRTAPAQTSPNTLGLATIALALLLTVLSAHSADTQEDSVIAPLAGQSLLLDGTLAGNRLIVVGERGHALLSDDNGLSWRQVATPTRATLTAVAFSDPDNGWAVGHDAVILHTSDAGEHWSLQHSDPDEQSPLLDIHVTKRDVSIAVGAYGLLLSNDDDGAHWRRFAVNSEDDFHLNAIATKDGMSYLAAEAGIVYRRQGDGHWQTLSPPYEGSFFGVLPLTDSGLLLFGLRGHLFHSEDRGETWARVAIDTHATLTDGLRLRDGRIVLSGHEGTVLWSDDGGRRFDLLQLPDRAALSALMETPNGKLLAVGERGIHPVSLPAKAQP